MNNTEFLSLAEDLRTLAKMIPLHWGHIQNNGADDVINMFKINTYKQLEEVLNRTNLTDSHKDYLRRRWYIWKCSQCDEFLFYRNNGCFKNPNPFDKEYDISINHYHGDSTIQFDVKGTVIPSSMRDNIEQLILNPAPMVDFFYEQQSKGRRYDIQNRLFIVHHSYIDESRELYLRCAWKAKAKCFETYINNINDIHLIPYQSVKASVIFILEQEKGKARCLIH